MGDIAKRVSELEEKEVQLEALEEQYSVVQQELEELKEDIEDLEDKAKVLDDYDFVRLLRIAYKANPAETLYLLRRLNLEELVVSICEINISSTAA